MWLTDNNRQAVYNRFDVVYITLFELILMSGEGNIKEIGFIVEFN